MHVPPGRQAVRDLMPAFFELLQEETDAGVRAVLGHFVFVYIHPCMDGNGRMGRFLMNVRPFTRFIAHLVDAGLKGKPVAEVP